MNDPAENPIRAAQALSTAEEHAFRAWSDELRALHAADEKLPDDDEGVGAAHLATLSVALSARVAASVAAGFAVAQESAEAARRPEGSVKK
jgi:hypothetical protein